MTESIENPTSDNTPTEPVQAPLEGKEPDATPMGTYAAIPQAKTEGPPDWAGFPKGVTPPKGANVIFARFRAEWTATPNKGDRFCACWPLTDSEEMVALNRSNNSGDRAVMELSKQMVRVIDGHAVDWSAPVGPGSIDAWWTEIGPKCRNMLTRLYTQTHVMDVQERIDFFANCVEVRTVS